jgi:hypothetical protein
VLGPVLARALPEQRQGALDQERLLAVEQVGGPVRTVRQRGERIPLRRGPAQNASTE